MQSVHALPHDRESRLGEISRERGDAFVAHGAGGRADHRDWLERRVRFEHIRAVLGVFAGGTRKVWFLFFGPDGIFWIEFFPSLLSRVLTIIVQSEGLLARAFLKPSSPSLSD